MVQIADAPSARKILDQVFADTGFDLFAPNLGAGG
jgi:hypothetical protein